MWIIYLLVSAKPTMQRDPPDDHSTRLVRHTPKSKYIHQSPPARRRKLVMYFRIIKVQPLCRRVQAAELDGPPAERVDHRRHDPGRHPGQVHRCWMTPPSPCVGAGMHEPPAFVCSCWSDWLMLQFGRIDACSLADFGWRIHDRRVRCMQTSAKSWRRRRWTACRCRSRWGCG